ncbi:MAG: MFS transporter [Puniceicoccales bacterium]|jgi:MFS family permease|nr:MFS transporter [Puniceicoccales bacterium]
MQKQGEIAFNVVDETNIIESSSAAACPCSKAAQRTLFFDSLRYLFQGAFDTEFCTVILLMACQLWGITTKIKVVIVSVAFLSMVLTPITQQLAKRSRWNNMQVSALYFALVGTAFFCGAFATSWGTFFFFMIIARIFDKQQIPLMIKVYCDNYPRTCRGFRVGTALACMPIGGIIFSQLIGGVLGKDPGHLCYALLLASFLALMCAVCFLKIPAQKAPTGRHRPLWINFRIITRDRLFVGILCLYSLVAIANQMTLPLRVEYLADHRRGLGVSYGTILAIFAVIQPLASIISGPFWGKLYDHVSLITMRQCVTVCFLIGIPLFFATDNINTIYLASILLGIGRSGGVIFWSLWVSGIAPRKKISEYMSANTAVMGLRDALAPLFGYILLECAGPWTVGLTAFILLTISLLGFESLQRHPAYTKRISDIKNN